MKFSVRTDRRTHQAVGLRLFQARIDAQPVIYWFRHNFRVMFAQSHNNTTPFLFGVQNIMFWLLTLHHSTFPNCFFLFPVTRRFRRHLWSFILQKKVTVKSKLAMSCLKAMQQSPNLPPLAYRRRPSHGERSLSMRQPLIPASISMLISSLETDVSNNCAVQQLRKTHSTEMRSPKKTCRCCVHSTYNSVLHDTANCLAAFKAICTMAKRIKKIVNVWAWS